VKIVIQRHTHSRVPSSEFQNISIFGTIHSDLGNMNSVKPLPAKNCSRMRSQPLIKKNPVHATRLMLIRSSSTVAAA
jgi:hypothetical protein